jgi:hypothetical protein
MELLKTIQSLVVSEKLLHEGHSRVKFIVDSIVELVFEVKKIK